MATFISLITSDPQLQSELRQAETTRERLNLAVTPSARVRPIVQERMRDVAGAQRIALADRRLDLSERAARFRRRLDPFAIGVGGLSLLTSLGSSRVARLRGERLQEQSEERTRMLQDFLTEKERQTQRDIESKQRLTARFNQAFRPLSAGVSGLE